MTAAQPIPQPQVRHQRSHGEAMVSLFHGERRARIGILRQQGSAKVILPHVGAVPEVVFLNTSGGLTGGDRLSFSCHVGPGLRAVATTQTAERAYRASVGSARVQVSLDVAAGGWLDWLPQETILFDSSSLQRVTRIDLAGDAGCIALESVVLGRAAMGETVRSVAFRDRREIWRDGRLVMLEPLRLSDGALTAGLAVLGAARAFASLVMIGQGAEDAKDRLRAVLDEPGVTSGASAWDGRLCLRMAAVDGWPLRRQIRRALHILRGTDLPRVWQL